MEEYKVAIVIPAFNEALTIAEVINSVKAYGCTIVVNDASVDNTQQIAEDAGAIVINHKENKGYDGALNSGFNKAVELNFDVVITFDADGQHSSDLLEKYIQLINENFQVVIGIRDRFQRIAEYIFSWVARKKWGILDPLCGMKAYHIDVYKKLGHFDSYDSIGTELSIFAAKNKINIAQLPIKTNKRTDASRFGNRVSANIRIFRALWHGVIN